MRVYEGDRLLLIGNRKAGKNQYREIEVDVLVKRKHDMLVRNRKTGQQERLVTSHYDIQAINC